MRLDAIILAALLLLPLACSSPAAPAPAAACNGDSCRGASDCPVGFVRDVATGSCADTLPKEDCPAGSAPFLGADGCTPVGWTACDAPFEKDPSGWGCRVAVPPSACPPGTRATLGSTSCVPIDDCTRPFPPPEATLFVDASFATTDAKHTRSIFTAVQRAKAGDVIAIHPGTYVEDVDVDRSDIQLVGKCARDVVIENPGDGRAGILVADGAKKVFIKGVTLRGHKGGVLVKGGAEATLEDSQILDSRWMGAYAAEKGSRLRVARTRIDGVVPDEATGKFGWGAAAQVGGRLELEDVSVEGATGTGVVIGGQGTTGTLNSVVVTRVHNDGFATLVAVVDHGNAEIDGALLDGGERVSFMVSGGTAAARRLIVRDTRAVDKVGRGVQVSKGGRLELTSSSIVSTAGDAQLLVLEPSSFVRATGLLIHNGAAAPGVHGFRVAGGASAELSSTAIVNASLAGLAVQDPATLVAAERLLVTGTRRIGTAGPAKRGIGIGVSFGGSLKLTGSAATNNVGVGILVSQADESGALARAEVRSTVVFRSLGDETGHFGRGLELSRGAVASVRDSVVAENNETSVVVGVGAEVTMERSLVRDTRRAAGDFGLGVAALEGGVLRLDECWLTGHPGAAIAVAAANASLTKSVVARSAVGVHVQGGAELISTDFVPAKAEGFACFVSNDTRFVDIQTRVGSGVMALPNLGEAVSRPAPKL